jgi:hypothetical protein
MTDLPHEEVTELITCALNKTGKVYPQNRVRMRVCEHLIGRGLMEPVKAEDCVNAGHYPVIVPTINRSAALRLTDAGRRAVLNLAVRDYDAYFPVASDIEAAQMKLRIFNE